MIRTRSTSVAVYWTAPAVGTDSQAGTLIHEMSHFDHRCGHR